MKYWEWEFERNNVINRNKSHKIDSLKKNKISRTKAPSVLYLLQWQKPLLQSVSKNEFQGQWNYNRKYLTLDFFPATENTHLHEQENLNCVISQLLFS